MTKTKAPMPKAAIFLLIGSVWGFTWNAIAVIANITGFNVGGMSTAGTVAAMQTVSNLFTSSTFLIFNIILCVVLFMRKRNGVLALATGLFSISAIYSSCASFSSLFSINLQYVIESIDGNLALRDSVLIVSRNVSLTGSVFKLIAYILIVVFALSVCDNIIKESPLKKLRSFTKKTFWLPAVLYLIFMLCAFLSEVLNFSFYLIMDYYSVKDVISSSLRSMFRETPAIFFLVFLLTFAMWIKKYYDDEEDTAITDNFQPSVDGLYQNQPYNYQYNQPYNPQYNPQQYQQNPQQQPPAQPQNNQNNQNDLNNNTYYEYQ